MSAQAVIFTPQARQAQADFREALECLARPGRVGRVGDAAFPVSTGRHAYSLLLALADQEVSIAVTGADETAGRFASLGTGSRLTEPDKADYVLCLGDPAQLLRELRRGTLEIPEEGATAIIAVQSLVSGRSWTLRGPGIAECSTLRVCGLSGESIESRNAACTEYPLGIDLFLVDHEGRLVGLPRTTSITMGAH